MKAKLEEAGPPSRSSKRSRARGRRSSVRAAALSGADPAPVECACGKGLLRSPYSACVKKADEASEQVTQVLFADPVDVAERSNGWAQVTLADGYEGWIPAEALGEPLPKDRAHVVVVPQAADRYLGTWLPAPGLRTEPLAAARRKASGEAIAEAALMFLGAPYEWGGRHRRRASTARASCRPSTAASGCSCRATPTSRRRPAARCRCARRSPATWSATATTSPSGRRGPDRPRQPGAGGKVVDEPHPDDLKARVRTVRRVYEPED